jgi:hypothetical protein
MKKRISLRVFVYFLCVSFLVMMNGFPRMVAEAKEKSIPIGEMISKGEVKFEARENVWKGVESSHFPIFQGTKIKTDKGIAVVTLSNNSQIEVSPNSLFYIDQNERFILSHGSVKFRIPAASEINFKVGNLSVTKSRTLQADKDPAAASSSSEETIGSISIQENGAVTVKSTKGKLTVVNQDRVVLAAVSPKDSATIPSTTVKTAPKVMVAQAGETTASEKGEFLGISTWGWVGIIAGAAAVGGIVWAIAESTEEERRPVCP